MPSVIRVVAGRYLGGLVATAIAWLAARYGIVINDGAQQKIMADLVGVMMFIFSLVYPTVHRWWDAIHNPDDAAKPALAVESRNAAKANGST